jgi:hypothetical protein
METLTNIHSLACLPGPRPTVSQFACSVHTCIFESIEGSLNLKHVKTTALFNQHELGAKIVHDVVIVLNLLLKHSHMCIGVKKLM